MSFGARIKALRKQRGINQRELAEKVGIDFTYLSKLENNRVPPPRQDTIRALAAALGADADELILLAGKIPPELAQVLVPEALEYLRSLEGDVRSGKDWGALLRKRGRAGR